jgi:hypothetical protein
MQSSYVSLTKGEGHMDGEMIFNSGYTGRLFTISPALIYILGYMLFFVLFVNSEKTTARNWYNLGILCLVVPLLMWLFEFRDELYWLYGIFIGLALLCFGLSRYSIKWVQWVLWSLFSSFIVLVLVGCIYYLLPHKYK